MYKTYGYAAKDARSPLGPFEFERRALREYDVQIDVMYCGVCHSDLHQARNEWGNTRKYRFVIDLNSLRQ
jgi:alcohol dehydrogenase (NADP+)